MKLAAVGLVAAAAFALSAGTASAQYVVRGGHTHGGGVVVSPGYGGYVQPAPSFGGSLYTPGFGGSVYVGPRSTPNYGGYGGYGGYTPAPRGHLDYVPAHLDPHRGHLDPVPAHYDAHRPGTRSPRH